MEWLHEKSTFILLAFSLLTIFVLFVILIVQLKRIYSLLFMIAREQRIYHAQLRIMLANDSIKCPESPDTRP